MVGVLPVWEQPACLGRAPSPEQVVLSVSGLCTHGHLEIGTQEPVEGVWGGVQVNTFTSGLLAVGLEACGLHVCKGGVQRSTSARLPWAAWTADGAHRAHCVHADVWEAQKHIALLAAALHVQCSAHH